MYAGARSAVPPLAEALAPWPSDIVAQTESLTATATNLRLRTRHHAAPDADAFAAMLKPDPDLWREQQPSMTTMRDAIQLELVWARRQP